MIRDLLVLAGIATGVAGCSASSSPTPSYEDRSGTGVFISGTAVTGVAGGSGQSARAVSGIKDLELSVGVDLGSR